MVSPCLSWTHHSLHTLWVCTRHTQTVSLVCVCVSHWSRKSSVIIPEVVSPFWSQSCRFDLEFPEGVGVTHSRGTIARQEAVCSQWAHFVIWVLRQAHGPPSRRCFCPVLSRVWSLPPWGVRALQAPAAALTNSDGTQQWHPDCRLCPPQGQGIQWAQGVDSQADGTLRLHVHRYRLGTPSGWSPAGVRSQPRRGWTA